MRIGIPREAHDQEARVAQGPRSVADFVAEGHEVYVEQGAGQAAGFADEEYVQAGATIVYSAEEAHYRSEIVCRVRLPPYEQLELLQPGQLLCCFAQLFAASPRVITRLQQRQATVLAYERLVDASGQRPILRPMSEIAGRLTPQIAATLLQTPPGRGTLLAGIPGIPPADVVILGAGDVGYNAARAFTGMGAQVTVLDRPERLVELDRVFDIPGRLRLVFSQPRQIAQAVSYADVLVGAAMGPDGRTPMLVSEPEVRTMRPGSVIIDVSIDSGGCVETSHPTHLTDPFYIKHGVIHYCLPSMTSLVARTASRALSIAARPYLLRLLHDLESLLRDPVLRSGLMIHNGRIVNDRLAKHHSGARSEVDRD